MVAFYCPPRHNPRIADPAECDAFESALVREAGAAPYAFGAGRDVPFPARDGMAPDGVRYFRLPGPRGLRRAYDALQAFVRRALPAGAPRESFAGIQDWRGTVVSSFACRPERACRRAGLVPPP